MSYFRFIYNNKNSLNHLSGYLSCENSDLINDMFFKDYIQSDFNLKKLIIGGVHGREGNTTISYLKSLTPSDFSNGINFIYNFNNSDYITTLSKNFYKSPMGIKILELISNYKPDFYIELHSYNIKNYHALTNPYRMKTHKVPPLIDLKDKILIGSASPLIRTRYFKKDDVCITLEIPTDYKGNLIKGCEKEVLKFLKAFTLSDTRKSFEDKV